MTRTMAKKRDTEKTRKPVRQIPLRLPLDGPLDAALQKYIEDTRPRPKTQAVIVTALEDFLRAKGYLSSVTVVHKEEDDDGSGT